MLYEAAFFLVVVLIEFGAVLLFQRHIPRDEWEGAKEEIRHARERMAAQEATIEGLNEQVSTFLGLIESLNRRLDDMAAQAGNFEGRLTSLEDR